MRKKSSKKKSPSRKAPLTRGFQLVVLGLNSAALLLVAVVAQATSSHSAVHGQKLVFSGQVRDANAVVACAAGLNPTEVLNQLNSALASDDGLTITLGNRPDGQPEQRHIAKPFAMSQPTVFPDRNGNTYVCVSVTKN